VEQVSLERLRAVDDWAQVELQVNSLDLVFRRAEAFSQKLKTFELTQNERTILTLVDNRNTVRHVIERSALPTFEVFHTLFRMTQVGLIRKVDPGHGPAREHRPVLILEADEAGVRRPLAGLLDRRRQPVPLVTLESGADLLAACLREKPRLVILNVSTPGFDAAKSAREVRQTLEISDVVLVAITDDEPGALIETLSGAGFDAVLPKPFLFTDIERLLAA
jgi:CheY-like chemotaxis protein